MLVQRAIRDSLELRTYVDDAHRLNIIDPSLSSEQFMILYTIESTAVLRVLLGVRPGVRDRDGRWGLVGGGRRRWRGPWHKPSPTFM